MSVHRGCLVPGGAWSRGSGPGWVPGLGGSDPGGVGGLVWGQCLVQGGLVPLGVPGGDPPGTATALGGMHPTGMHSC